MRLFPTRLLVDLHHTCGRARSRPALTAADVTVLRRSSGGSEGAPPAVRPVTPRQPGRWFWQAPNRRSQGEQAYLTSLVETDAHSRRSYLLRHSPRWHATVALTRWLHGSTLSSGRGFVP